MIESVLVANRGEIAIRVMRTCRRMGIRTVAVFSDADARAMHVAQADEALHIGASVASASYLNQSAILDAARRTSAHAIHPGYGFLSENAEFAQSVADAGVIWIGPEPAAMRAIGDKAHAKALAEQHNVPLLPGYHSDDESLETLRNEARRIGFPLMIKASAGGGGRGMRVVETEHEFEAALEAARREAKAAFGDERVLLERYVRRPRHVEVQIIGDRFGNLIHLGERECSIQRRHQKLIEESPSPAVDADLRDRMGDAALRLARAANYSNAGTVEFLLDDTGEFAFLEVNARLQVEHPVTEAITGLDLVELQLRIASGEPLGMTQADVRFNGHAIEARVIAEDPLAGFLPSSGRVERFSYPPFARVDTWVRAGTEVSPYYDSLLAKVVVAAATREAAVRKLADALREVRIRGVHDNVDLLLATIETPEFLRGDLHTGFLDEHRIVEQLTEVPSEVIAAASAVDHFQPPPGDPWQAHNGWRVGRIDQPVAWLRAGRRHSATVSAELTANGVHVDGHHVRPTGEARVSVDGLAVHVQEWEDERLVRWQARTYRLVRAGPPTIEETARDRSAGGAAGELTAPMPGRIVKIAVEVGQEVTQNQPLVVLEAMKMEHVVEAPHAGVVAELPVAVGAQVSAGAHLATIK